MSDNPITLTPDECNVLIESLVSWESKHVAGEVLATVMQATIMSSAPEEVKRELSAKQEEKERRNAIEATARKEVSVLLRAKLIQLRNHLEIEAVTKGGAR